MCKVLDKGQPDGLNLALASTCLRFIQNDPTGIGILATPKGDAR